MPFGNEQNQRRHVGGGVDQLSRGRGTQEIVSQQAHKQKNQKAARTWPEKSIVKPDDSPDGRRQIGLFGTREARRVVATQLFFKQRVDQHRQQDPRQHLAQVGGRHHRDQPGPGKRGYKTRRRRRQQGSPTHLDAAAELHGGKGRAPDRGAFVGAKQGGRRRSRENGKQGGHQNQAATAHNRIHKPGQERGERDNEQFHAAIVALRPKQLCYFIYSCLRNKYRGLEADQA